MTTSTDITPATKVTLLKHLASGKSAEIVATIVKLPRDQVVDIASHHGYPDRDKLAWAADILEKKIDDDTSTLPVRAPDRVTTPIRPAAGASTPPAAGSSTPSVEHSLIDQGKQHPSKRIQACANKVLDDLDRLRTLLREDETKHAARRKAEREKAAARAEVERLQQQLAEAKAKLRGGKQPAKKTAAAKPARVPGALDYPCRNDGCDKAYDTPQGRSLHERMKCEHRAEAAAS